MSHDTEAARAALQEEQTAFLTVNFAYMHLPPDKAAISRECSEFVWSMFDKLPPTRMRQNFLDYMLLAKDAAVRASLPRQP